jgi:uncharacterized protein (DUF697 family)
MMHWQCRSEFHLAYIDISMSRVIEVPFSGDANAVIAKARASAEKHGAVFEGDHVTGKFSGNGISGHYQFTETVVVVTIESKPDFAPWPFVEMAIRKFFESAEPPPAAPTEPAVLDERKTKRIRADAADALIRRHVLFSTGAGLIPIPLADVAAVTGVQVKMLEELTKLYNAQLTKPTLENFVAALTGGMIARIGASAVKALPGIGTLLGGASMSIMSGASTYAVGQVAKRHLETDGTLANVDLAKARREYGEAYESGKDYVENLDDEKKD